MDVVANYTEGSIVEQVRRQAGERGLFELVVDHVCGDFGLDWRMREFSGKRARYVMVGWGPSLGNIGLISKANLLRGVLGGGKRELQIFALSNKTQDLERIATLVVDGKAKSLIDSKHSTEDAVDGFRRLKFGRAVEKVVVEVAKK